MSDILRIGNASGYWGDDLGVLRRQIEGGPLDVVTMDFLAAILSLPFFIWVGYAFSQNLEKIQEVVGQFRTVSLSVIGLVIAFAVFRWWRGRKTTEKTE